MRRMAVAGAIATSLMTPLVTATQASGDVPSAVPAGNPAEESEALAQAVESGEPVEVIAHRTEASQVFANPSGTLTQDLYATAQWARKGGSLVDLDTTLSLQDDGMITPHATTVGLEFSGGGEGPLATITRDGRSISLTWPAPLPPPRIADDTVVYPEVLPDVDLKLRATASGFAQLLVIKSAQAAANPDLGTIAYGMSGDGVEVTADEYGNMSAVNPGGQELFTAPTPRMWDSSTSSGAGTASLQQSAGKTSADPPSGGDEFEPGHGAQQAAIGLEATDDSLKLTPDQELLTGEDTQYPVYIDPYIDGSRYSWTIAYKKYPNSAYYNGSGWSGSTTTTARAGYENEDNGLARSYFQMRSGNLWNTKKQILKSTFRIKNTWSWSCTAKPVELWSTSAISSSTTWNNRPARRERLDTVTDAKGWSSACPAGNLAFNTTAAAKDAATGKWPTITLELAASNESDTYGWKKFDAKSAVLSTEYNTVPSGPQAMDTSPSTKNDSGCNTTPYGIIGNTDLYLTAKVSDLDGGTLTARFILFAPGHHPDDRPDGFLIVDQTVSVTSGTVARLKVPKTKLTPYVNLYNGQFAWKVQALDARAASAMAPSTACRFLFDPTRPSTPPGISSSQFPDGSNGWPVVTASVRTQGSFTLSNGGVTDVTKYEYWTDTDPTVRTATPASTGGSITVKFTPTSAGANRLYARSVDKAGNKSDQADYLFYANGPKVADAPGDINGDGNPDMWAVDKDGTLRRFYGAGDSTVTEASATASSVSWSGAEITHRGDWTGDGYEDLIALHHDTTANTSRLWIHPNTGFGFACSDCSGDANDQRELTTYDPGNNHWQNADEILSIGDVDGPLDVDNDGVDDIPGHPDLLVRQGNLLWLYFGSPDNRLDTDRDPVLIGPDGWSKYTLMAPGNIWGDERVDLLGRDTETGDVYLYTGTGDDGDGLADQSTKLRTGTGFTTAAAPLLTSPGDADHDGYPDLWLTDATGHLRFAPRITKGDQPIADLGGGWSGYQVIS
ncbi:VCBS repeat-containing protein [Streptomyces atrovirens]